VTVTGGAMLPTEAETPPGRNRKRRRDWKRVELLDLVCPLAIGALVDSIFSAPFFPRMLIKPRTVCACQEVAFMI